MVASPPRQVGIPPKRGDTLCAHLWRTNSPNVIVLDEVDVRILSVLQRDGRISKTGLGEIVGLSPSACLDRMRRLEKKKLIVSYHAILNIRALCHQETFFMEVSLRTHRADDFSIFERYVQQIDEILECYALGGGIDYLLKIVCPNIEDYQCLVDNMLDARVGIDRYFTYIQTKAVKLRPQIPIDRIVNGAALSGSAAKGDER